MIDGLRGWLRRTEEWAPRLSMAVLLLIFTLVILAPIIAPTDPLRIDLALAERPPGAANPLGTDRLGRDLLSRMLYGGRTSLAIATSAAVLITVLGSLLGGTAGYRSGLLASIIDRLTDVTIALPVFYILLALQAVLPPSGSSVVLVIGLTLWTGPARVIRGQVLGLKQQGYIEAARALGCSDACILVRHILPNCAGQIAAVFTAALAEALLIESSLSFIGLGVRAPTPSWGNILLDGIAELLGGAWWMIVFPGLAILITVSAVSYASERFRSPRRN